VGCGIDTPSSIAGVENCSSTGRPCIAHTNTLTTTIAHAAAWRCAFEPGPATCVKYCCPSTGLHGEEAGSPQQQQRQRQQQRGQDLRAPTWSCKGGAEARPPQRQRAGTGGQPQEAAHVRCTCVAGRLPPCLYTDHQLCSFVHNASHVGCMVVLFGQYYGVGKSAHQSVSSRYVARHQLTMELAAAILFYTTRG
jgi:hypothetical protein